MPTTSAAPPRVLTASEKRAAEEAAAGRTDEEIARRMSIGPRSVSLLLSRIGRRNGGGRSRPARIYSALAAGLITPLVPARGAPDFTDADLLLIRALAEHSEPDAVAAAARLHTSELIVRTALLVLRAGARDATHLVALAHAWELLDTAARQGSDT
ncbi:hypothetical protein ACFQ7N_10410 [Streptomyces niveus]|uniref:hypothetical protein n=1 Tax=Streptomyces niveus TaxID=193462 RepID=UPI0036C1F366